ncbi:MAG: hypothetical protein ACI8UR_002312 [Natronomonas sp.]|jgi:hypothetical protein|uniref:hypothetical protein n=1 Tax=Natronomonas sp. TaxID=2184060 RepID=UPI00398A24B4
MARAGRRDATGPTEPTVHNEGPSTATIRIVVHDDGVSAESVTLDAGDSHTITVPSGVPIEVHAANGTVTANATRAPLFIVREGRVLVATE